MQFQPLETLIRIIFKLLRTMLYGYQFFFIEQKAPRSAELSEQFWFNSEAYHVLQNFPTKD